jgi:hypothetical protein
VSTTQSTICSSENEQGPSEAPASNRPIPVGANRILKLTEAPSIDIHRTDEVNGQPLAIDDLQDLSPDEREIVRESDQAFAQLRGQTWAFWKKVGAGLVILRDLAMRQTGTTSVMSKRYKDRFHALLEHRAYCGERMSASTRKALLRCAELSPELDEWHDSLDEDRRLQLNHPVCVLGAFYESKKPKLAPGRSPQARHEAELEKVQQEAATAVASRDALVEEQQQQIDRLTNQADSGMGADTEAGIRSIVDYVIARCGTAEQVRAVISGLAAHLEQRPS